VRLKSSNDRTIEGSTKSFRTSTVHHFPSHPSSQTTSACMTLLETAPRLIVLSAVPASSCSIFTFTPTLGHINCHTSQPSLRFMKNWVMRRIIFRSSSFLCEAKLKKAEKQTSEWSVWSRAAGWLVVRGKSIKTFNSSPSVGIPFLSAGSRRLSGKRSLIYSRNCSPPSQANRNGNEKRVKRCRGESRGEKIVIGKPTNWLKMVITFLSSRKSFYYHFPPFAFVSPASSPPLAVLADNLKCRKRCFPRLP
jgi:hypothetical protein